MCRGVSFFCFTLPSADNKASHQEDEENDSPGNGHSQNGGLVRVPDSKHIYIGDKREHSGLINKSIKEDGKKLRVFSAGGKVRGEKMKGGWE